MDAIYQQLTILLALATLSDDRGGDSLAIVAEEPPKAEALVSTDGP
jgi:hypothetical protein